MMYGLANVWHQLELQTPNSDIVKLAPKNARGTKDLARFIKTAIQPSERNLANKFVGSFLKWFVAQC